MFPARVSLTTKGSLRNEYCGGFSYHHTVSLVQRKRGRSQSSNGGYLFLCSVQFAGRGRRLLVEAYQ